MLQARLLSVPSVRALCLTVGLCLAGFPALAQDGGGKGYTSGVFWGTDLDRNEYLSGSEARAPTAKGLHRVFRQVDQDGDGKIHYYEFAHFLWDRSYCFGLAGVREE